MRKRSSSRGACWRALANKSADFLVLDGNPLDAIANTRKISAVYLRGARLDREALRAELSRAQ